jgi:hypothetical protein
MKKLSLNIIILSKKLGSNFQVDRRNLSLELLRSIFCHIIGCLIKIIEIDNCILHQMFLMFRLNRIFPGKIIAVCFFTEQNIFCFQKICSVIHTISMYCKSAQDEGAKYENLFCNGVIMLQSTHNTRKPKVTTAYFSV